MATIVDDKSPICIPFILERLKLHREQQQEQHQERGTSAPSSPSPPSKPFIIGLNGVQGVGKTTLVRALANTLQHDQGLETLVCSIDDFYLRREDQQRLADEHPDNKLLQVRGEPGTHDLILAESFFSALCNGLPAKVPQYDKSAYSGKGDRVPESQWTRTVNDHPESSVPIQVVILEGWCVGFRSLSRAEVEAKYNYSYIYNANYPAGTTTRTTLRDHSLEHLLLVNECLRGYDTAITDLFDAFIHIDAEDTQWVYDWRLEQEVKLRQEKGTGMTDDEVVRFVDAYYPAYELFCDKLRAGIFPDRPGAQLRIVVGKDRRVKEVIHI